MLTYKTILTDVMSDPSKTISTVASDPEPAGTDLKDAVSDLFAHMEKHERKEGGDEVESKGEDETNKTGQLVKEPIIFPEELVPLGDLKTSLPTEKSLLDARVVFVIGKHNCPFLFNLDCSVVLGSSTAIQ